MIRLSKFQSWFQVDRILEGRHKIQQKLRPWLAQLRKSLASRREWWRRFVPSVEPLETRAMMTVSVMPDTYSLLEDDGVAAQLFENDSGVTHITGILVNGSPAELETPLTLASGATLTVHEDGEFVYTAAGNVNGNAIDTFSYTAANADESESDSASVTFDITAVNDAPTFSLPGSQSILEDGTLTFSVGSNNSLFVGDVDAGAGSVEVTLTATHGTLTLAGTQNLTFTVGDGVSDAELAFCGSLTDIQQALDGLVFTPTANFHGNATISVGANDLGNSGGEALSANGTIAVTVQSVNDAPTANNDEQLPATPIAWWKFDEGGGTVATDASGHGHNGTLLNNVTWSSESPSIFTSESSLDFDGVNGYVEVPDNDAWAFGTDDFSISVWANLTEIPPAGPAWSQTIFVTSDVSPGATPKWWFAYAGGILFFHVNGLGSAIFVGAPFELDLGNWHHLAVTRTAAEGFTFYVDGIGTAADRIGYSGEYISDDTTGVVVPNVDAPLHIGQGEGSFTHGKIDDVRIYNFSLSAAGIASLFEDGTTSEWRTIRTIEDTPLIFAASDLLVNDVDEDGDALTITQVSSTSVHGGTVALSEDGMLTYTPAANFNGTDTFTYTISDGHGGSDTATVSVIVDAINDAPAISAPAGLDTLEDSTLVFSNANQNPISISDIDADSDGVQVTLSVAHGVINLGSFGGISVLSNTGTTVTFVGTVADINVALQGQSYTPDANYFGDDALQIEVNDQGNTGVGGPLVAARTVDINVLSVNDSPSFSIGGNIQCAEDSGSQMAWYWLTNISVGPANESSGYSFTFTSDHPEFFTYAPSLDGYGNLYFTPAPDAFGSVSVTITMQDFDGVANGGVDTSSTTFTILITPVNDAPSFNAGSGVSTDEDTPYNALWASYITTGPANENQTATFTVWNDNNALFSVQPSIDASGVLSFTPAANASGYATLGVTLSDGVDTTSPQYFSITVNAVNDAPVHHLPESAATDEDTALVFSSANQNALSITDLDVDSNPIVVTLSVDHGTLTLGSVSGLTITAGTGTNDTTVTFYASLYYVNNALEGLTFLPDANYFGTATLHIDSSDQGATGSGGPQTDSDTLQITVSPVNDAPVAVDDWPAYTSDLAGWWLLNDGAGDVALDMAHGSQNAVLHDGPTWVSDVPPALAGISSGSLSFAGTGDYATLPNLDHNNLTVAAWVKRGNSNPWQYIVGSQQYSGWTLYIDDANSAQGRNHVNFLQNGGYLAESTGTIDDTEWHHIAVSYDGIDVRFYIDGELDSTVEIIGEMYNTGGANYYLGSAYQFAGGMADVRIYSVTLDDETIEGIAAGDLPPPGTPSTLTTTQNTPLHFSAATYVLANDHDPENDTLSISSFNQTSAHGGTVDLHANGTFTYTPAAHFSGLDSFVYTISDGHGGAASATVHLQVDGANSSPDLVSSSNMTTISEDINSDPTANGGNAGVTVGSLMTASDVESGTNLGIAVIGLTGNYGVWQYSSDPFNSTWITLGPVSETSATLLTAGTYIRFQPNGTRGTSASISFRAWDQSNGLALGTTDVDVSGGGGSTPYSATTATTLLTVTDVNDAPVLTQIGDLPDINEDSTNNGGVLVSSLLTSASDVDFNPTVGIAITNSSVTGSGDGQWQYKLSANGTWTDFSISTGALLLSPDAYVRLVPDTRNGTTGALQVRAWDQTDGNDSGEHVDEYTAGGTAAIGNEVRTAHITVASVNDAPQISNQTFSVNENVSAGTLVGTVVSSDVDVGDSLTFQIIGGSGTGVFAIDNSGHLTLQSGAALNYEAVPSYTLTVRVTDSGSLTATCQVTVLVANINEAPILDSATVIVNENLDINSMVHQVTGYDPEGSTLSYSFDSNNNPLVNDVFQISISGQISLRQCLNTPNLPDAYYINVIATDDGTPPQTGSALITVFVNHAPTDLALSPNSVSENLASGTTVGVLSASDVDIAANHWQTSYTYSLVAGTGSGDNSHFAIAGDELKTADIFDFEGKSSYSIRVRVTDDHGLQFEKVLTVSIADANDAPALADQDFTMEETAALGSTVGTVAASDEDAGQTLTFSMTTGTPFQINPNTGVLSLASTIDPTRDSYTFAVTAADDGSPSRSHTADVTVHIHHPLQIQLSAASVDENRPANSVVGSFSSPGSSNVTYSLVSGSGATDNASFTVTGGILRTTAAFNFEVKSSYSIRVQAVDSAGNSVTRVFSIAVNDRNDPPVLSASHDLPDISQAVNSNANDGVLVATLFTGSDEDPYTQLGIAVTQLTGTNGVWQYSNSPGSWVTFGAVSDRSATLLAPAARVRFQPDGTGATFAGITFRLWDQSNGLTSGATGVNASNFGADNPYSAAIKTSHLTVANLSPIASPDSVTGLEDTALVIQVLGNDSDPENDSLKITGWRPASHGTVVRNANNTFTYTPNPNFNGTDSFSYAMTDGHSNSNTVLVQIVVTPVNDQPTFVRGKDQIVLENAVPQTVVGWATEISTGPADEAAQTVAFQIVSNSNASLFAVTPTVDAAGVLRYTPAANVYGTASITLRLTDNGGTLNGGMNQSPSQVFSVTVDGRPRAFNNTYATDEDHSLSGNFVINPSPASDIDFDPEQGPLTVASVSVAGSSYSLSGGSAVINLAAGATLRVLANGYFSYDPHDAWQSLRQGASATQSFTYTLRDAQGQVSTANVTLNITGVNDAPVAEDDGYSLTQNSNLTVNAASGVLSNDSDIDQATTLTAAVATDPAHGTLTLNSNGSFTYTPNAGYWGTDSFTYVANDGITDSDPATVTLTIEPVPFATGNFYSLWQNGNVTGNLITDTWPLGADFDIVPSSENLTAAIVSGPEHGNVTLSPNGAFLYASDFRFAGWDSFTYKVDNGDQESQPATVLIFVSNTAPSVPDVYASVHKNPIATGQSYVNIDLLESASDMEHSTLEVVAVETPRHGTMSLVAGSVYTYTPDDGFVGDDTFSFTASDGAALVTRTITVSVTNEAPYSYDIGFSVLHDTTFRAGATGYQALTIYDSDSADDAEFIQINGVEVNFGSTLSLPSGANVTLYADGNFVYQPRATFVGKDFFVVSVSDGAEVVHQIISMDVTNQPPFASSVTFDILHDREFKAGEPGYGPLSFWDYDSETLKLFVNGQQITPGADTNLSTGGSLVLNQDGSFIYDPVAGFLGQTYFTLTVSDRNSSSSTVVYFNVTNSVPYANDATYAVWHDTLLDSREAGNGPLDFGDNDFNDTVGITMINGNVVQVGTEFRLWHGNITLLVDKNFTYRADPGFVGTEYFSYTVSDGRQSATANVKIYVTNNLPSITNVVATTPHDTKLEAPYGFIPISDDWWDLDKLRITAINGLTYSEGGGERTLDSGAKIEAYIDGHFTYKPATGFVGRDWFIVTVTDGAAQMSGTVFVDVTNTPPDADNRSYSVVHDQELDTGIPYGQGGLNLWSGYETGDTPSIIKINAQTFEFDQSFRLSHGNLTMKSDGNFIYRPDDYFVGIEHFTYTLSDGADWVTRNVDIEVTNDPPTGQNRIDYEISHGETLYAGPYWPYGVYTSGGSDDFGYVDSINGYPIAYHEWYDTDQGGSIRFLDSNNFEYEPDDEFIGLDHFVYAVGDDAATKAFNVYINVTNTAPTTRTGLGSATAGVEITGDYVWPYGLGTWVDDSEDWDDLTFSELLPPSQGTLELASNGYYVYSPYSTATGFDVFGYQVTDGIDTVNGYYIFNFDASAVPESQTSPPTLSISHNGVLTRYLSELGSGTITLAAAEGGTVADNGDGTYSFTPDGTVGRQGFWYSVEDSQTGFVFYQHAVVVVTNSPPIPEDHEFSTRHGQAKLISNDDLLAGYIDGDWDTAHVVPDGLLVEPQHGYLTWDASGVTYTPFDDFVGQDFFSFIVSDGIDQAVGNVTIDLTNTLPVATDYARNTLHGQPVTITVPLTDSEGDTLTPSILLGARHGTAEIVEGKLKYTPFANYAGPDSFAYVLSDGAVAMAGNVYINVTNISPTANDYSNHTPHDDLPLTDSLTYPDGDDSNSVLELKRLYQPLHGASDVTQLDGTFTYTSGFHFVGPDQFAYTVSDKIVTVAANVILDVRNHQPTADEQSFITPHGQAVGANLEIGDADGDQLFVTELVGPRGGNLDLGAASFTYTPNANFSGWDSFTYQVTDGVSTNTATVWFQVLNNAPVAWSQYAYTHQGVAKTGNLFYSDVDANDALTLGLSSQPLHGQVSLDATNRTFTYTPEAGYIGVDSFAYIVSDGVATVASTVHISVTDEPPTANWNFHSVPHDQSITGALYYDDPDDSVLTLGEVVGPAHGTLSLDGGTHTFTYTPDVNYVGADSFVYYVSDGISSAANRIELDVTNSLPWAGDVAVDVGHNEEITQNLWLHGGYDSDSVTLSLSQPEHGSAILNPANGTFTYTPDAEYVGADSFSYTVDDGPASFTATVFVNVTNDEPLANPDDVWGDIGDPITIDVLGNDTDPDADSLTIDHAPYVVWAGGPTYGTVEFDPHNPTELTYTADPERAPSGDFNDTFTYYISDEHGGFSSATVTVHVTGATAPPWPTVAFSSASYTVNEEDGTATITVTLSNAVADTVTVHYSALQGLQANSALDPDDFTEIEDGVLTFEAGETSASFVVDIVNDYVSEGSETVYLSLFSPENANLGAIAQAELTILDSDLIHSGFTRSNDPQQALLLPIGEAVVDLNTGSLRLSHDLDFDLSPGNSVGGSPQLSYNSATVSPRPIIKLNIATNPTEALAPVIHARLVWGDEAPQAWQYIPLSNYEPGQGYTIALQVDDPVAESGLYNWRIEVEMEHLDGTYTEGSASGLMGVVVRNESEFGAGWGISGVDELVPVEGVGVLWIYGNGDSQVFTLNAQGGFDSPGENFGKLTGAFGGGFEYVSRDGNTWNFNADGRLTSWVDRHQLAINYGYDGLGRLIEVHAPDGGNTSFDYSGGIVTIHEPSTLPPGSSRDVTITSSGIVDSDGSLRSFLSSGGLITQDAWYPYLTTFAYDSAGLLISVDQGLGSSYAIVSAAGQGLDIDPATPAADENIATITNGLDETTTYRLDLRGRQIFKQSPAGANETWIRNSVTGQVTQYTDPSAWVTTYGYTNGDLTSVLAGDGSLATYVYDQNLHKVTESVTYPAGGRRDVTINTYNPDTGDLESQTVNVVNGPTTQFSWNSDGTLQASIDPEGNLTTYSYDDHRRLTGTTILNGMSQIVQAESYTYDDFGNYKYTINVNGTAHSRYSSTGRLLGQDYYDVDGILIQTTSYTYLAAGQTEKVTDGEGIVTTYVYNRAGLQTSTEVRDANGTLAGGDTFGYDPAGNLDTYTDGEGDNTTFNQNADGYVTESETRNAAGDIAEDDARKLDARGNVLFEIDGDGNFIYNTYDVHGNRETREVYDWTGAFVSEETWLYNTHGSLTYHVDPNGAATLYVYDDHEHLLEEHGPIASRFWVYNANGDLTDYTDGNENHTHYVRDDAGRATEKDVYDSDGILTSTESWTYDGNGRQLTYTDPLGKVSITTYDEAGRVKREELRENGTLIREDVYGYDTAGNRTSHINLDGDTESWTYSAAGQQLTYVDANDKTTVYGYNLAGQLTSQTLHDGTSDDAIVIEEEWDYGPLGNQTAHEDAVGNDEVWLYDKADRLIRYTDASGATTVYEYDAAGRTTREAFYKSSTLILANLVHQESWSYDKRGNTTSHTDRNGKTETWKYDAQGNVIAYTDALGNTTESDYDDNNNLIHQELWSSANYLLKVFEIGYNANNEQVASSDAENEASSEEYDDNGNLLFSIDVDGNKVVYDYDAENRLIYEAHFTIEDFYADPVTEESWTYNAAGLLASHTDPEGNTETWLYNAARQTTFHTNLKGDVTETRYDSAGRTTHIIQYSGSAAPTHILSQESWLYDDVGNLLSHTDPRNKTESWTYDAANRVKTHTDPNGNVTYNEYDGKGRTTLVLVYDADDLAIPVSSESWSYNDATRRVTHTDPNSKTESWVNNADGQLAEYTDADGNVTTYEYDPAGRLVLQVNYDEADLVIPVSTEHWEYDDLGNQLAHTDPDGNTESWTYDGANRVASHTDADGNLTIYAYDRNDRVTMQELWDEAGYLVQVDCWEYDDRGNVTWHADIDGNEESWEYDSLNRLEKYTDPVGAVTTYAYDDNGRVLSQELRNAQNVLVRGESFTYDPLGAQTGHTDPLNHTEFALYDAAGRLKQHTDNKGNKTTYEYDAAGNLTTQQVNDAANLLLSIEVWVYDDFGNLSEHIDPEGEIESWKYDGNNRVEEFTDRAGNVTTYDYDPAGRLITQTLYDASDLIHPERVESWLYDERGNQTSHTDPEGNTESWTYDSRNLVLTHVDLNAKATFYAYDPAGRLLRRRLYDVANPDPITTTPVLEESWTYDELGRQSTHTNPLGKIESWQYDASGNVFAYTGVDGNTSLYEYDGGGRVVYQALYDDPDLLSLVRAESWQYDDNGRQISYTDPNGATQQWTYDAAGNVKAFIDIDGQTTTSQWDAASRITAQEIRDANNVLLSSESWAYDFDGNVETHIDSNGYQFSYLYDGANRIKEQTVLDAQSQTVDHQVWTYTNRGEVETHTDFDGRITTSTYDDLGRLKTQDVYESGVTTTQEWKYDAAGNLTQFTDALGRTSKYTYDDVGRKLTQTLAFGTSMAATTTYEYDDAGNITSLTDPLTNETTFHYDAAGNRTSITDPLSHTSSFEYDDVGRMLESTDRLGRRREFDYDDAGRLLTETWFTGSSSVETITYTYDAAGNMLTASNSAGTYSYEYDDVGRLTHVDEPFGVALDFEYDARGNRTLVTDSFGGTTASVYDLQNRLIRQVFTKGSDVLRIDQTYDWAGRVKSETRYSDAAGTQLVATSVYTYDALGRLRAKTDTNAANSTIAAYTWTYDAAGQLTAKSDHGETIHYTYDAQGQLIGDDSADSTDITFDANGNRAVVDTVTQTVSGNNQLTNDGTWTYTYDAEGNLTKKSQGTNAETWTYGYDHANHLTHVEKHATDGGSLLLSADYKYDPFGNRIQKSVDADGAGSNLAVITNFALDGWNPAKSAPTGLENWDVWADLDANGALTTEYLRGDQVDQLFARVATGAEPIWYLTDNLGSIRDLITSTGANAGTIAYDAWGNITQDDADRGRYAFTSRELDVETNLQYNRARYYDAITGRWISQDPLGFDAGDSNLYRYVTNDPVRSSDPSGLLTPAEHEAITRAVRANPDTYAQKQNPLGYTFGELAKMTESEFSSRMNHWGELRSKDLAKLTDYGDKLSLGDAWTRVDAEILALRSLYRRQNRSERAGVSDMPPSESSSRTRIGDPAISTPGRISLESARPLTIMEKIVNNPMKVWDLIDSPTGTYATYSVYFGSLSAQHLEGIGRYFRNVTDDGAGASVGFEKIGGVYRHADDGQRSAWLGQETSTKKKIGDVGGIDNYLHWEYTEKQNRSNKAPDFNLSFDPNNVSFKLIRSMYSEGLVRIDKDLAFFADADVTGTQVTYIVLQQKARLKGDTVTPYYQVVDVKSVPVASKQGAGDVISYLYGDYKNFTELTRQRLDNSDFNAKFEMLKIIGKFIPVVNTGVHLGEGNYGEAAISMVDNLALLFTLGGGMLTKATKVGEMGLTVERNTLRAAELGRTTMQIERPASRIIGMSLGAAEAGIGGYRVVDGAITWNRGDQVDGAMKLGEGFLRLFGVSLAGIAYLRQQNAIRTSNYARTSSGSVGPALEQASRAASSPRIPRSRTAINDWESLERQMTAYINDVADDFGIQTARSAREAGRPETGTWLIEFSETQANLHLQYATVRENSSGGGRILFDSAILFPQDIGGTEIAKLSLRARIQAILTHEVVEGNVARRLGYAPRENANRTHDLSLLLSPFSDFGSRAEPGVVQYLRLWAQRGGNPP